LNEAPPTSARPPASCSPAGAHEGTHQQADNWAGSAGGVEALVTRGRAKSPTAARGSSHSHEAIVGQVELTTFAALGETRVHHIPLSPYASHNRYFRRHPSMYVGARGRRSHPAVAATAGSRHNPTSSSAASFSACRGSAITTATGSRHGAPCDRHHGMRRFGHRRPSFYGSAIRNSAARHHRRHIAPVNTATTPGAFSASRGIYILWMLACGRSDLFDVGLKLSIVRCPSV